MAAIRLLHGIAGLRIGQIKTGGGEQKQLYLVTRIALAGVLAKNERQMVVLDYALTSTDTGRLVQVMTILQEGAEHLQILVLTCHPE